MAEFIRIHTREEGMHRLINVQHIERIDDHISGTEKWAIIYMANERRFACEESFDQINDMLDRICKVTSAPINMDKLWDNLISKID